MRKLIFMVLVSVLLLSCRDEIIIYQGADMDTYYFDVSPSQWTATGDYGLPGFYYYAERNFSALTNSVIQSGAVLVYVIWGDLDNQLPFIVPDINDLGELYSRLIRYDLQRGKIGFIIEDTDFFAPRPPIESKLTFKVVVLNKR